MDVERLEEQCAVLKGRLECARASRDRHAVAAKEAVGLLRERDATIDRLRAKLHRCESKLGPLHGKLSRAYEERDDAIMRADGFLAQIKQQGTAIRQAWDERDHVRGLLSDMQRQHDHLRDRFDVTNKELKATNAINKTLVQGVIAATGEPCGECGLLRIRLREASVQIEALTIESNQHEDEGLAYARRVGELETERLRNEGVIAGLRAKLSKRSRSSDVFDTVIERMVRDGVITGMSARPGMATEIEFSDPETKKLFESLGAEVSGLRTKLKRSTDTVLTLQNDICEAQAENMEFAKIILDLRARLDRKVDQGATVKAQTARIKRLLAECEPCKTNSDRFKDERDDAIKEYADKKDDMNEAIRLAGVAIGHADMDRQGFEKAQDA